MSELYYGVLENLPYIAGSAGYVAGSIMDSRIDARLTREITEQRQPIVDEYARLLPENESGSDHDRKSRVLGSAAVIGAFIGLTGGLVWQYNAPPEAEQPSVELVIDYSGATGSTSDGEAPVETTNKVVSMFAERDGDDFDVRAFVARSGDDNEYEPKDVFKLTPFGEAPLERALNSALNQITVTTQETLTEQEDSGSAIVVVTHGNTVGSSTSIAERAQEKTPVFIVNVEEGISEASQASLEAVAEATGGEYWNADEDNIVEEVAAVIKDMEPPKQELDPAHGLGERILAGVFAGLGVAKLHELIQRRKNEPLTSNGLSVPMGTKGE